MPVLHFPPTVFAHLARKDCSKQLSRAQKQLDCLRPILDRYWPRSILDIGCGLAIGSILAARYVSAERLALMDGDGSGALFSDYRTGAPAWNDVALAGEMARANLPSSLCQVITLFQDPNATVSVDMIVSFKSWGTHYPIGEYIPLAQRSLRPGGVVVTDLRPGDEAFRVQQAAEMCAAGFKLISGGSRQHVFERL